MSLSDSLLAVLTVLTSLALVIVIIGAAWWLMWKVKFSSGRVSRHSSSGNKLSIHPVLVAVVPIAVPVHQRDSLSAE